MPRKQIHKTESLIEELTTYKNDYQLWPYGPAESQLGVQEKTEPLERPRPPAQIIDIESHGSFNPSISVPFNVFGSPDPIIGKNPWLKFEMKIKSEEDALSRKNRPAPILTPAVPLDEIEDEELRRVVLNYTYTTVGSQFLKDAALPLPPQPNPTSTVIMNDNVKFKPTLYPDLPPGWICAGKHWDSLQSRALGDPFRTFWTSRGPKVECGCCSNPLPKMLPQETKQEIRELIDNRRLRLPYDETKVGYRGYRPICAKGVPLAQKRGFGCPE